MLSDWCSSVSRTDYCIGNLASLLNQIRFDAIGSAAIMASHCSLSPYGTDRLPPDSVPRLMWGDNQQNQQSCPRHLLPLLSVDAAFPAWFPGFGNERPRIHTPSNLCRLFPAACINPSWFDPAEHPVSKISISSIHPWNNSFP